MSELLEQKQIQKESGLTRQSSEPSLQPVYVVKFISAEDIPAAEYRTRSDPYIRAYLAVTSLDSNSNYELQKISPIVSTCKKIDATNVTWNSFRDFRVTPPSDAVLVIELLHALSDPNKPDPVLGVTNIPISTIENGEAKTFFLSNPKNPDRKKNPKFSITLQRVWQKSIPPRRKTFFLIRHGQSKWNEAQSKMKIGGMLDRDHALTELGIQQAQALNHRWKEYIQERHDHISEKAPPTKTQEDSKKNYATANLLDGYDEEGETTAPSNNNTSHSFADSHSVFDFMNDDFVAQPETQPTNPEIHTPPAKSLKKSSSGYMSSQGSNKGFGSPLASFSDDIWNDEEFNESYTRFTESIVISENDSCVNFDDDGNEEGNAESSEDDEDAPEKDTSFESRLSRLSLRAAQKYSLSLALQNEQKKLDLAYDASALKSPAKPETITEETEGQANEQDEKQLVLDPEYMTAAEEQSKADDQQQQQQPSNKEKGKNRLSASADELLKDLHNSKLVLQGMDENIERRKKEYMKLFLHSDRIYSSPLTRALQTAVISMEGHRCLGQSGITLYSVIREVKRLGGLDTVGIECGEGIAKRLRSEFYQHTPHFLEKDKLDHLLASFPLEVNDADQPWWTAMTSTERTVEQQERVREFLTFARYCDAKLPVFVGHSLFFKAFYSRRLSHELIANRQSLSENLKKFRLSNASMLAVTVRFQDKENGTSDAMIIDADLIFGGGFHGVGVDDPDGSQHTNLNMDETYHGGQSTRDSHGGEGGGSGNHRGSIFAESPLKFASSLESNNIQNIFNSIKTNEFTSNLHQEMKEKADILSKGVKKLSEKIYDIFEMN